MSNVSEMTSFSFIMATTQRIPDHAYIVYLQNATNMLWRVFPPILLVVGTVGNIMSIVVLSRKAMRKSNAAIYMIVLAVMDTLVLYMGLLRHWMKNYFHVDIRHLGPTACKLHTWLLYVCLDMSVWVLVALTIERLVSVFFPYIVRIYCTAKTSFISLSVIAVLLLAINSHFLCSVDDVTTVNNNVTLQQPCVFVDEFSHFGTKVWPWIDLCIYSVIPMTLIIISNIAIVVKVLLSRRRSRRVQPRATVRFHENGRYSEPNSKQLSSMTAMMVTLNMVLLVTTVPISAYLIAEPYIYASHSSELTSAQMLLAWAAVNFLQYTNHSVNFFLYYLSGSRFRDELRAMCRRGRRVSPASATNNRLAGIRLTRFGPVGCTPQGRDADNTTQITTRSTGVTIPTTKTSGMIQPQRSWPVLEHHHQQYNNNNHHQQPQQQHPQEAHTRLSGRTLSAGELRLRERPLQAAELTTTELYQQQAPSFLHLQLSPAHRASSITLPSCDREDDVTRELTRTDCFSVQLASPTEATVAGDDENIVRDLEGGGTKCNGSGPNGLANEAHCPGTDETTVKV